MRVRYGAYSDLSVRAIANAMVMNVRWCLTGSGDASEEYKLFGRGAT
jgi:hypothetical protein